MTTIVYNRGELFTDNKFTIISGPGVCTKEQILKGFNNDETLYDLFMASTFTKVEGNLVSITTEKGKGFKASFGTVVMAGLFSMVYQVEHISNTSSDEDEFLNNVGKFFVDLQSKVEIDCSSSIGVKTPNGFKVVHFCKDSFEIRSYSDKDTVVLGSGAFTFTSEEPTLETASASYVADACEEAGKEIYALGLTDPQECLDWVSRWDKFTSNVVIHY